ncbi:MAG: hypothetical protein VB009_02465 [Erysipelotrichaceae bacterium]|nr:hypothetical protein [Erysipelotrichaceae bacterium]
MRKSIIISLVFILLLSGCGAKVDEEINIPKDDPTEIDESLLTVDVVIPFEFFYNFTEEGEEFDPYSFIEETEEGMSVVVDEVNETITITMPKATHYEFLQEMKTTIDEAIAEILSEEDIQTIKSISYNNDLTVFTLEMNVSEVGFIESFLAILFYMYGGMYQMFNGVLSENMDVVVNYVYNGEIIGSGRLSELE